MSNINEILEEVSVQIASGKTVAIKGLGGYHLMCDALNNNAVSELRKRKQRDSKPFAVMFRDITAVRKYCFIDEAEEKELKSWRRPILILKQKKILVSCCKQRTEYNWCNAALYAVSLYAVQKT